MSDAAPPIRVPPQSPVRIASMTPSASSSSPARAHRVRRSLPQFYTAPLTYAEKKRAFC